MGNSLQAFIDKGLNIDEKKPINKHLNFTELDSLHCVIKLFQNGKEISKQNYNVYDFLLHIPKEITDFIDSDDTLLIIEKLDYNYIKTIK